MRSELSEVAAVPQVFEPGARVAWEGWNKGPRVLSRIVDSGWKAWTPQGEEIDLCSTAPIFPSNLRVIAPAPREGQRWGLDGGTLFPLKVAEGKTLDAVAVARAFMEVGINYAGPADALAPIPASEATPASEPTFVAAPWTIVHARRLITSAIADYTPRRPEAFTAALCSLAERETPSGALVLAVAVALCVLEEELPEHGAAADWQIARAMPLAEDAFRAAAQLDHVPTDVEAAIEMYVARRDRARS